MADPYVLELLHKEDPAFADVRLTEWRNGGGMTALLDTPLHSLMSGLLNGGFLRWRRVFRTGHLHSLMSGLLNGGARHNGAGAPKLAPAFADVRLTEWRCVNSALNVVTAGLHSLMSGLLNGGTKRCAKRSAQNACIR